MKIVVKIIDPRADPEKKSPVTYFGDCPLVGEFIRMSSLGDNPKNGMYKILSRALVVNNDPRGSVWWEAVAEFTDSAWGGHVVDRRTA